MNGHISPEPVSCFRVRITADTCVVIIAACFAVAVCCAYMLCGTAQMKVHGTYHDKHIIAAAAGVRVVHGARTHACTHANRRRDSTISATSGQYY